MQSLPMRNLNDLSISERSVGERTPEDAAREEKMNLMRMVTFASSISKTIASLRDESKPKPPLTRSGSNALDIKLIMKCLSHLRPHYDPAVGGGVYDDIHQTCARTVRAVTTDDSSEPPLKFAGYLWKKNPADKGFWRKYVRRYFVLRSDKKLGSYLSWYKSAEAFKASPDVPDGSNYCKGFVNLSKDPVVVTLSYNEHVFTLRPEKDRWTGSSYANEDPTKPLNLSVEGSEHTLQEWMTAIFLHNQYAKDHLGK